MNRVLDDWCFSQKFAKPTIHHRWLRYFLRCLLSDFNRFHGLLEKALPAARFVNQARFKNHQPPRDIKVGGA